MPQKSGRNRPSWWGRLIAILATVEDVSFGRLRTGGHMHALSLGCRGPAFDDGGMVRGIGKWFLAISVVIMALACPALCAASAPEKNELVLYSFSARETFVAL